MTDWTEELHVRLRALWNEGLSTAEIGRRIGASKNAVVGKAHRLHLPTRPSPIRRHGRPPPPPRAPRAVGPTLPPFATPAPVPAIVPQNLAMPTVTLDYGSREVSLHLCSQRREAVSGATLAPLRSGAPVAKAVILGRVRECCWPLGEPGTPAFRFCADASVPGKPYCVSHCTKAFLSPRAHRVAAA